jgi:hypothetical protein
MAAQRSAYLRLSGAAGCHPGLLFEYAAVFVTDSGYGRRPACTRAPSLRGIQVTPLSFVRTMAFRQLEGRDRLWQGKQIENMGQSKTGSAGRAKWSPDTADDHATTDDHAATQKNFIVNHSHVTDRPPLTHVRYLRKELMKLVTTLRTTFISHRSPVSHFFTH